MWLIRGKMRRQIHLQHLQTRIQQPQLAYPLSLKPLHQHRYRPPASVERRGANSHLRTPQLLRGRTTVAQHSRRLFGQRSQQQLQDE